MKLLIMQSSSAFCHFLPLRSKYTRILFHYPFLCIAKCFYASYCGWTTKQTKRWM